MRGRTDGGAPPSTQSLPRKDSKPAPSLGSNAASIVAQRHSYDIRRPGATESRIVASPRTPCPPVVQ